eukprot:CAMPEP_0175365178 /NCGR_PEP_ID=MMETSP0095-20121207/18492_1 /TAXON_ID=311494 /ORGANISM="Alexandrium monilatum, Strain CCMP3105" /LENGTH=533 /DNA_ID=CAMNT_0016663155 /DNA_START=42 /DNA_END=1640 /DNA_ORIENTATION=-
MADLMGDLTRFDLRFPDPETEASFKADLEPELLRFGVLGALILELLIPLTLVPVYIQEANNTANPYDMEKDDVRTIMLVLWLFCFAITGIFCIVGLLRIWLSWFQGINWEALFVLIATYYGLNLAMANFWHLPLIFGHHPTSTWSHDARGAEVYILLALDGIITVVAMYIPVRSCALWVLPLCSVGSYATMLVAVDTVFPDDRFKSVCALIGLTVVAAHGAYRNEQQRREKWIALQQVSVANETVKQQETQIAETTALVKGLRTVANALCDIIVKLNEDLKVFGSESMLDSFFEKSMEGRPFTDVLASSDIPRFKSLINSVSASQVHACMPVTIRKASSICEAHLLLVDAGRSMPRYFLGIRVEMEHLEPFGGQDNSDCATMRPGAPDQPDFMGVLPQPPGMISQPPVVPPHSIGQGDADESDFSFTTFRNMGAAENLAFTSVRARAISLKKVMPRWNIPRDAESCCQFHTVVDSIHEVADFLAEKSCEPLWSTLAAASAHGARACARRPARSASSAGTATTSNLVVAPPVAG